MKNFTISEAAKLSNVTRQTLIYYDKIGLLKPDVIEENGYRYYTMSQVETVKIINMLKTFGIPLKEIKGYLDKKNKDELLELFSSIKIKMKERITEAEGYLNALDRKEEVIEESLLVKKPDIVFLEELQERRIFKEGAYKNQSNHFQRAYNFEKELQKKKLLGITMESIVEKSLINKNYNNEISSFCVTVDSNLTDERVEIFPGGLYVSTYNQGPYRTSAKAYKRLIKFIEENNLEVDGDAFETVVDGFLTEKKEEDYLLKVSIKVKEGKNNIKVK